MISRNTIRADIIKLYKDEKENTMKLLSKNQSSIVIISDMWISSYQNNNYI